MHSSLVHDGEAGSEGNGCIAPVEVRTLSTALVFQESTSRSLGAVLDMSVRRRQGSPSLTF